MLHQAIAARDVRKVKKLIKDADNIINDKDSHGDTPLHKAVMNDDVLVVGLLLEQGTKLDTNVSEII